MLLMGDPIFGTLISLSLESDFLTFACLAKYEPAELGDEFADAMS